MKRPIKIALWTVASIAVTGFLIYSALMGIMLHDSHEQTAAGEKTSKDLVNILRHFDPSVRVLGAFEASSYGGWHGDGGSVTIYLIDPSGVDALIAGIDRYRQTQNLQFPNESDFVWAEGTRPDLSGLGDHIPKKYQPPKDTYRMGETPGRTRTIAIGKASGYVSFGTNSY
jgi:hypothetical protein